MSRGGRSPGVDLRLNLSPPREANSSSSEQLQELSTSSILSYSSEITIECSSGVSSEAKVQMNNMQHQHQHATTLERAMLLLGCPRCLMYIMLSDANLRCPKCKSTVLLDFLNEGNINRPAEN